MYSRLTKPIAIVLACLSTVPGLRVGVQPYAYGSPTFLERVIALEKQYGLNVAAGAVLRERVVNLETHIPGVIQSQDATLIARVVLLESFIPG